MGDQDQREISSDVNLLKNHFLEFLKGGFAPIVILLREFHFDKSGIALDGLPFSAWSLLEHMRQRQRVLLDFIKDPDKHSNVWPDAFWPDTVVPPNKTAWENSMDAFERDLSEIMKLVSNEHEDLFKVHSNGKTLAWAVMAIFHHNAYTIGQIKAIGRQLGVW